MARSLIGRPARLGVGVALLLAATVLTLNACGNPKTAADPLLGTWQSTAATPKVQYMPLIITKDASGYLLLVPHNLHWGAMRIPLSRQDDVLTGSFTDPRGRTIPVRIVYLPQSGELSYTNGDDSGKLHKPGLMRKISESTTVPTPSVYSPSP